MKRFMRVMVVVGVILCSSETGWATFAELGTVVEKPNVPEGYESCPQQVIVCGSGAYRMVDEKFSCTIEGVMTIVTRSKINGVLMAFDVERVFSEEYSDSAVFFLRSGVWHEIKNPEAKNPEELMDTVIEVVRQYVDPSFAIPLLLECALATTEADPEGYQRYLKRVEKAKQQKRL